MTNPDLSSKTAAVLMQFPGPASLQPSRRKWLLLLAGSLGFVAGGIWVLKYGRGADGLLMWLAILFFGLCAAVGAVMLLPGAGGLVLNREGFMVTSLFRRYPVRWSDCSAFEVRGQPMVVYDDASKKNALLADLSRSIAGRNSGIPDNYGLPHDDLASLMNAWRQRALAQR